MPQPVVYAPPQYVSYAVQDAAYLRTVRGDGKPADPKVSAYVFWPQNVPTLGHTSTLI